MTGSDRDILDVQRFGDRLDLLAREPDKAQQIVEQELNKAHVHFDEIHIDEPTLENTFVSTLRNLGQEPHAIPFPRRHDHSDLRGQTAIGASDLIKMFGSFKAVNNVNLEIKYGEVYGLLGANGAGKTTTIKMLCGLLEPSHGQIQLAGESGSVRSADVRMRIGYMSQKFSLYDDLSIKENLNFFAGVYGVPEDEREEKLRWVLSFSGLEGKENQITRSLPGGWKQRVAFGAAIMHEPTVLFLDEPTSGVDPLARRAFWSMINELADAGSAILVTTHYLEESEQCNRLGMMVAGELVAEGRPGQIKAEQKDRLIEFVVDQPQRASDLLKEDMDSWRVSLFGDRLHVITEERNNEQTVRQKLESGGINVVSAREARFSMEDVFISVVAQAQEQKLHLEEEASTATR
jgi:drug efflux transport system ATP-binding protein